MNSEDRFLLVNAVHPHWEDKLVLSGDARKLITRATSGDTGVYELSADALTVTWDKWPKERFVKRKELYVFEAVPFPSASKPEINSFDIFDTLVARRCVLPDEIFRLVERRTGYSGFAEVRKKKWKRLERTQRQVFDQASYRRQSSFRHRNG
jgi:hypothetical protein